MSGYHEVADAFAEFTDLNPYLHKEIISGPYPNDHYGFGYTRARKISVENPDQR